MKVKICGLSTPEAVDAAVAGGAHALGFVFHPKSPRNVTIEQAAALMARVRKNAGDDAGRLMTSDVNAPDCRPRSRENAHEAASVPPSAGPQKIVAVVGALPLLVIRPPSEAEKALISEAGRFSMAGRAATGVVNEADSGAHVLPASLEAKTRKK